jgi:hypothetical protein
MATYPPFPQKLPSRGAFSPISQIPATPLPTPLAFPANPPFPNCTAHKNGHPTAHPRPISITLSSSRLGIRGQLAPTSPRHYLFMSWMPVFGAESPVEPRTMAFPYQRARPQPRAAARSPPPAPTQFSSVFPCCNNLPMKPQQGPHTPRQTARNDETAPGRGRSAPDVEDEMVVEKVIARLGVLDRAFTLFRHVYI